MTIQRPKFNSVSVEFPTRPALILNIPSFKMSLAVMCKKERLLIWKKKGGKHSKFKDVSVVLTLSASPSEHPPSLSIWQIMGKESQS